MNDRLDRLVGLLITLSFWGIAAYIAGLIAALLFWTLAVWTAAGLGAAPAHAQDDTAAQAAEAPSAQRLGPDELRKLVAPIALYPDELLALVLPAATNPLQIVQAQRFLEKHKVDKNLKPDDQWDPSVLALLNYPEAIKKMNDDLDWTEQIGNAVIDQQSDVLDMIQQIRSEAHAGGYLKSDDKQVVVQEKETIVIQSADPEVIYVPSYDPEIIYVQNYGGYYPPIYYSPPYPYYYYPGAAFWTGVWFGAAFSYGFDWGGNDIDINYGNNCCNNINIGGDGNIGDGNFGNRDRVDHHGGDRFNADRQRVNGQDKMKWNGNKARQKQTQRKQKAGAAAGTLPARSNRNAATTRKTGAGSSKLKNPYVGDSRSNRGNKSSLGNYQSNRDSYKARNQGNRSLERKNQKHSGSQFNQNRTRQKAGSFGGYGNGSRTMRQSNRGSSSMRSSRGGRR
jgi:Protein of unknown function (DUF3300)